MNTLIVYRALKTKELECMYVLIRVISKYRDELEIKNSMRDACTP